MVELEALKDWIANNESFLSGVVALVVLAGVVLSPVGSLFARLRARRAAQEPVPAGPALAEACADDAPGDPLLAVLAFDNLSNDPEMQFFSDGVSEEIIQRLSSGAGLRVMGRTSSFQFRGPRKAGAAAALKCSHVLDGSVQRSAGRVRINAHLEEVRSSTTLWSERYDRDLEDVFAVQDELSQSISGALNATFRLPPTGSIAPDVYDLYLRARPQSFAPAELRERVAQLEEVTRLAPEFAEGWGRLAYVRAWLQFYQPFAERPAAAARVRAAADRALALDPHNVDALAGRLFVIAPFGDFGAGDTALRQLVEAPGWGDGIRYVGWYMRNVGWVRQSLAATSRAYRLDALDPMTINMMALAHMAAGDVAAAIPLYETLVEQAPDMSFPVSSLLRAYAFAADWAAVDRLLALAASRDLREMETGLPFIRALRDRTPEVVGQWWREQEAYVTRRGRVDAGRLVYAAHLGRVDDAFALAAAASLGPAGDEHDVMGPDGYRTALFF